MRHNFLKTFSSNQKTKRERSQQKQVDSFAST
ncbi:Uncharacterized protein APZ42_011639 [Daphnia magna]|uniref:Uncharacterized protein n=1 Tax=Daphnia magna TaxID=35525 RepID=A0A162SV46_9CRUS|nr:Uncharacterized protein APZ42_011639 [Daphnia magna]